MLNLRKSFIKIHLNQNLVIQIYIFFLARHLQATTFIKLFQYSQKFFISYSKVSKRPNNYSLVTCATLKYYLFSRTTSTNMYFIDTIFLCQINGVSKSNIKYYKHYKVLLFFQSKQNFPGKKIEGSLFTLTRLGCSSKKCSLMRNDAIFRFLLFATLVPNV